MEVFFEILKITIPALAVMATAYFTIKQLLENQFKRKELELRKEAVKAFSPNKINAYERLILLLERIHPAEMVLRVHQKGMTSQRFQSELLKTIREEFQHNLTQQIYVSSNAWNYIRVAKEETIKMINLAASNVPEKSSALDLSNMIFQIMGKMEHNPVDVAKDYLKQEVRRTIK